MKCSLSKYDGRDVIHAVYRITASKNTSNNKDSNLKLKASSKSCFAFLSPLFLFIASGD